MHDLSALRGRPRWRAPLVRIAVAAAICGACGAASALTLTFDDLPADAASLTLTAFGAKGDLGEVTTGLTGTTPVRLDTSSFAAYAGITGYRFETTAADFLDEAAGRAYVIADDLTFSSAAAVPEPANLLLMGVAGMATLALAGRRRLRARTGVSDGRSRPA